MISFAGLLIAVFFMMFFCWLFSDAYLMGMDDFRTDRKIYAAFLLYAFAGAVLLYYLLMQERTIHASDWWIRSYTNMIMLFSQPLLAVLRLGGTVLFGEYNTLPCMITAFPLKLFGYSYVRYVLVNYAFFYVPACFIVFSILRKIFNRSYSHLLLFMTFMFVPIQIPRIGGFIDTSCLIPAALALLLMDGYDASSLGREQIKRDVYISVLLLLTMLFRRYFAFFIVGYMSAFGLLSLYQVYVYSGSKPRTKVLMNAVMNIAVIGFTALVIMVVFLGPLLYRILMNKYAVLYAAWDAPMKEKLLELTKICGWFPFVFALIGLILSLARKRMRKYACFCAVSSVVTIFSFFSVQAMSGFQAYTFIIQLFILSCIGIIHILELLKDYQAVKKSAVLLCVLIFTANLLNCYFPVLRAFLRPVSMIFNDTHTPQVMNNIDSLYALADYVNAETENTDKKVYVLTGPSLSEYMMECLYKPYRAQGLNNHIKGRGDDLIDGFPVNILAADIIITSYSESDDYGTVWRVIARELNDESSLIGRHFTRKDRSFKLDDGAEAFVFEKQQEFTDDDLHGLADYFTELYPGREDLYAKRILGRLNQWDIQDHRNRALAVRGIKWLLDKKILTPEQLAAVTDRSVEEINLLAGH